MATEPAWLTEEEGEEPMTIRNDDASNLAWLERETRDREAAKTLHVFGDDCEWVIAESLGDAWEVLREHGYGDPDNDCCEWEQESDTKRFTCRIGPDGRPANPGEEGADETMTCAEWAARLGRGYFCTTEY